MKCKNCSKPVIGEMQSFCRHCLYSFESNGDRWFSLEDEKLPVKELE